MHLHSSQLFAFSFFFFNDTSTTQTYTLSLHDALPISRRRDASWSRPRRASCIGCVARIPTRSSTRWPSRPSAASDRKSTRLNSSHQIISYAVFCLKKKKKKKKHNKNHRQLKLTTAVII